MKILLALVSASPLIYIASVRYDVGTDYSSYVYIYRSIANGTGFSIEPLFALVNRVLSFCNFDYPAVFTVCAIIFLVFVFMAIYEESPNCYLSIFLLVSAGYYFMSLNVMRQMVSCAILLWSVKFVSKRQFLPFVIAVIVALGFHYSSILFLIVYFLNDRRIYHKYVFIIFPLFFASSFLFSDIIVKIASHTLYSGYFESNLVEGHTAYLVILIQLAITLLAILFYDNNDKKLKLFYNIQVVSLFLSALSGTNILAIRLSWPFSLPSVILLPFILTKIKDPLTKFFVQMFVIAFYCSYIYYSVVISHNHGVLPYDTIFNHGFRW